MTQPSINVKDLIPTEGFLGDWIRIQSDRIMAPIEFHLAAGLAALSTIVGKGVTFTLGGKRYPSLWQLVLAPAGVGKSVALTPLRTTIENVRAGDPIIPSRFSPEAFFLAAGKTPDGCWIINEIGGLLGMLTRNYASGFELDLCDAWDHTTLTQKLVKEERKIIAPALSVIATGRASDFTEQAGLERFTSGFLSRFLVLTTNEPPAYRGLKAQVPPDDAEMQKILRSYLIDIKRVCQPGRPLAAKIDDTAVARWEKDDRAWNEQLNRDEIPEHLGGFAKRRGIQALKLAILYAVSKTGVPEVSAEAAAWGCRMAQASYESVVGLISGSEMGLSATERKRSGLWRAAVAAAAADSGVVKRRDFIDAHWRFGTRREFEDLLGLWAEAGKIRWGTLKSERGFPAKAFQVVELGRPAPLEWAAADSD